LDFNHELKTVGMSNVVSIYKQRPIACVKIRTSKCPDQGSYAPIIPRFAYSRPSNVDQIRLQATLLVWFALTKFWLSDAPHANPPLTDVSTVPDTRAIAICQQ